MADKSVSIDLIIKSSEAASSLKEVKQSLKDIKDAMIGAGEGTPEFLKLAAAASELKDQVDDANDAINAMNPNRFQALASFAASAAGGISAVTGAMGLLGAESENVQEAMLKVQSAMAFSQGLAAISEMPQAWASFKTSAVSALNAVKAAIGATGIGLIVIALGTIYAYWDDIKGAVSGVSEEQKKLNKASDENLKIQQKKLDAIGGQDNILKLQGKSEKDILKIKISQTDETIKAAEISILQAEQTKEAQVKAAQRNKDILKGTLDFVSIPLTLLLAGIDAMGTAFGKDFGLREGFKESVANMIFDPNEVEEKANESIEKSKIALEKLKNDRAGFELAINAIDKTANDKSKAISDEKLKIKEEELKKLKELADKYVDEQIKAEQDEEIRLAKTSQERLKILFERGQAELIAKGKQHLTDSEEDIKIRSSIQTQLKINQSKFNDELAALDKAERQKKFDTLLSDQEKIISDSATSLELKLAALNIENEAIKANQDLNDEERIKKLQENVDREVAITKTARQAETGRILKNAQQVVNGLQAISDLAFNVKLVNVKKGSKEEEAALRKQFKINKALQLATATIQGIQNGITAYGAGLLAGAATTAGTASIPMGIAYASVSALASMAAIAKIAGQQFEGGGGSVDMGGGGNSTPTINEGAATATNNSQPSTLLNPDGTVQNQQPVQVYVVESDITSTQTQVAVVQNQMNFE
jgi:hypothetical protein